MTESRCAEHFQRLYESSDDPWSFASSLYEQDKYRRTIQALDGRRFAAGLEAGCSIGVLTRLLADRCDSLLGIDIIEKPLQSARLRCAAQPWVRFQRMRIPQQWPDGRFDLIVFSEVLYFLSPGDIQHCASQASAALLPGGCIVLVNWLGVSDDPCSGEEAAERFIAAFGGQARTERHQGYRFDMIRGCPQR